jgi:hypothetical protein
MIRVSLACALVASGLFVVACTGGPGALDLEQGGGGSSEGTTITTEPGRGNNDKEATTQQSSSSSSGNPAASSGGACTSGFSVCSCGGGSQGFQTCGQDGKPNSACACPDALDAG